MAWALRAADWSPRSGSGSADDAETGVCDFLQITVKTQSSEETGVLGKAIAKLRRIQRKGTSHTSLQLGGSPAGSASGKGVLLRGMQTQTDSDLSLPLASGRDQICRDAEDKMLGLPEGLLTFSDTRSGEKVNSGN